MFLSRFSLSVTCFATLKSVGALNLRFTSLLVTSRTSLEGGRLSCSERRLVRWFFACKRIRGAAVQKADQGLDFRVQFSQHVLQQATRNRARIMTFLLYKVSNPSSLENTMLGVS